MVLPMVMVGYHFVPDWNISTAIGWLDIEFCTDIHVSHRINCNNFCGFLTFLYRHHQVTNFNLSSALVYDHLKSACKRCHCGHVSMLMLSLSLKQCHASLQPHRATSMALASWSGFLLNNFCVIESGQHFSHRVALAWLKQSHSIENLTVNLLIIILSLVSLPGCSLLWMDQTVYRLACCDQVQLLKTPSHNWWHMNYIYWHTITVLLLISSYRNTDLLL